MNIFLTEINIGDLLNIVDALPDELMGPTGSDSLAQNGTMPNDVHQSQTQDTTQKHRELTQLLSQSTGTSTPPQRSTASPMMGLPQSKSPMGVMGNLNNAVKSPLSNTLSSPPHGINVNKPSVSQHTGLDQNFIASSGALMGHHNQGLNSNVLKQMVPNLNSMGMGQGVPSMNNMSMGQQNQMLSNGPHYSTSGHTQLRGAASNLGQQLPSMTPQSVMGGMNAPQQMHGHNAMGQQSMLNQNQQMMKVLVVFGSM